MQQVLPSNLTRRENQRVSGAGRHEAADPT
jgi:hypothetical protein